MLSLANKFDPNTFCSIRFKIVSALVVKTLFDINHDSTIAIGWAVFPLQFVKRI